MERKWGANPFKFGMIGSTDAHTSLATAAEENFFGKHSGKEPTANRWNHPAFDFNGIRIMGWQQAASGYAAVWATENTRETIFDAMQRKETYARTGSRMTVRFFGGWDFVAEDAQNRLPADAGYRKPAENDKLPLVGNTVDLEKVTWTNTIGAPELISVWRDPDFNPGESAFYYARVIEIPTPRWTAYDAQRLGVTMSEEVPMWTQERAYTSPIWYTPKK
jgi:hypothetical protein